MRAPVLRGLCMTSPKLATVVVDTGVRRSAGVGFSEPGQPAEFMYCTACMYCTVLYHYTCGKCAKAIDWPIN